ncbi:hypothetical protein RGUI_2086 [Rhodovulum sp. P5]|nr:hypothetical protein RGUI_2086 [Rhodovulum sp. P5]
MPLSHAAQGWAGTIFSKPSRPNVISSLAPDAYLGSHGEG